MGRRLGTGESFPFESFRHMEAFRSSSRAAIGRRSDAHFLYWQGRPAPPRCRAPGIQVMLRSRFRACRAT
ncbi:hypothetical protein C1I94_04685 [Akkermansia muciniphila]|nr:hypothetical protein C1I94_04685 [Akkermansia muciniphila]QAA43290.1 hypothetical protein C1I96_04540 [Akkermansia muciniphila]QAA47909.1 hypothetical protein C1O40_04685 [Akkermansia muciniphila]QAA50231.1 hypothetical protein C1O47_04605 [Akkermansia muciniphila]QHV51664.1 hypothetical protein DMI67_09290 [Akkermansia muciniphila]